MHETADVSLAQESSQLKGSKCIRRQMLCLLCDRMRLYLEPYTDSSNPPGCARFFSESIYWNAVDCLDDGICHAPY